MISKNTFVTMIDTISEVIEESKAMCRCPISGIFFDENSKSELLAGCDYQQLSLIHI